MNIIKKIVKFIIISVLIAFLIFIIILRFYSPIKQKLYNDNITKQNTKHTIVCLGDSSTAGQYPIQLQKILNRNYPGEFSVVDCGIAGTNLETISDLLDTNIKKYNPDIVVCMMGDSNLTNFSFFVKKTINLRLKYLLGLLKEYLYDMFFNNNLNNTENKAIKLFHQHDYEKAEKLFIKVLDKDPNRVVSFFCLFFIYRYSYSDAEHQKITYEMAKKAIDNDFVVGKCDYYNLLIENNDNIQEREYYINKAINDKNFDFLYLSYKQIINAKDNDIETKKALLNKISANDPEHYNAILGVEYLEKKDYQKAEEYFSKAEQVRLNRNSDAVYDLYKTIVKKLLDKNIKVICMQYPMRSIKNLEKHLKKEPYYDQLILISNEKNFKDAVFDKGYDKIFRDQNAGDSGHSTDLGNEMIAENIFNSLKKIIN